MTQPWIFSFKSIFFIFKVLIECVTILPLVCVFVAVVVVLPCGIFVP